MRNVRFVCYLGVALLTLFCVLIAHSVFHRCVCGGGEPFTLYLLAVITKFYGGFSVGAICHTHDSYKWAILHLNSFSMF